MHGDQPGRPPDAGSGWWIPPKGAAGGSSYQGSASPLRALALLASLCRGWKHRGAPATQRAAAPSPTVAALPARQLPERKRTN